MKNTLLITVATIGLLLNGCKKEEKAATAAPKTSAIEVTPKSFGHEAEKDLLEMKRLAQIAKNNATAAKTQTAFSQWAGGINRFKQVYGFYPNIGAAYDSTKDSVHPLEDTATNLKFVKALSGRQPTGAALSVADRRLLNRNGDEFCEFRQSDFDDLANLAERSMLVDGFGNSKIRIIFDTDNNTVIRNIKVSDLPEEISAAATEGGIKARVIIYSKGENGAPDVVAIQ
jgi:hypothetical protein